MAKYRLQVIRRYEFLRGANGIVGYYDLVCGHSVEAYATPARALAIEVSVKLRHYTEKARCYECAQAEVEAAANPYMITDSWEWRYFPYTTHETNRHIKTAFENVGSLIKTDDDEYMVAWASRLWRVYLYTEDYDGALISQWLLREYQDDGELSSGECWEVNQTAEACLAWLKANVKESK